jgi:hypothetical protein
MGTLIQFPVAVKRLITQSIATADYLSSGIKQNAAAI